MSGTQPSRKQSSVAATQAGRRMTRPASLLLGIALVACGGMVAQDATRALPVIPQSLLAKIDTGQFPAAETDLRALLRLDPSSSKTNFLLGYVLFREGQYVDSLAAYTAGARFGAPDPDDLLIVSSDYIQLRSYPDAVRWLTYVTEQAPDNARAWYLLGRTQYQLDRPEEALHAFEHCLQIKPRNLPAKYNAGLALERLQRNADAESAYREAITWATQDHIADPQPWLDLGNLLLAQQKFRDAANVLATAVATAPNNPLCQQQLGVALDRAGDYAQAVTAFERAIALAPKADRAHYYLARTLRQLGRTQQAAEEFALVDKLHSSHEGQETPNPDVPTIPPKGGKESDRKG